VTDRNLHEGVRPLLTQGIRRHRRDSCQLGLLSLHRRQIQMPPKCQKRNLVLQTRKQGRRVMLPCHGEQSRRPSHSDRSWERLVEHHGRRPGRTLS